MATFGGFGASSTTGNPNGDFELKPPPNDTTSCLEWSPAPTPSGTLLLAAGAWDNQVRVYEIQASTTGTNGQAKAAYSHQGPVLDVSWNKEGTVLFSGGCDNQVIMWDPASQQQKVLGKHDAPVKCVHALKYGTFSHMVVTGSWDKTLRYWDTRTGQQAMQISVPERVYCMDVNENLMVVATANRKVLIYDIKAPQKPFQVIDSPLRYQSRCVACFRDNRGFALGSIEGRVAIHHVQAADKSANFAFKCHRVSNSGASTSDVYPVNAISFHPKFGTFATAGADGGYNFWDKDSKQRLKQFKRNTQPVTCSAWNSTGQFYAYGVGYDWHKGSQSHDPKTAKNFIYIHTATAAEIQPRAKK